MEYSSLLIHILKIVICLRADFAIAQIGFGKSFASQTDHKPSQLFDGSTLNIASTIGDNRLIIL